MKDNKPNDKKRGMSPVAAAAAGAAIGAAAVGIAGVVALANKKRRRKIEQAIDNTKDTVEEKIAEGREKIQKIVPAAIKAKKDLVKAVK